MSFNNTNININNNSSQNIDNIAQSFFIVLIFCSLVSDSYLLFDNFIKNDYIKKKVNYCKKIYKINVDLFLNNYEKDDEGNIIINKKNIKTIKSKEKNIKKSKNIKDNTELKSKNPFDEEYDNEIIENNIHCNKELKRNENKEIEQNDNKEIDQNENKELEQNENKELEQNDNKELEQIENKELEQIENKELEQIENKELEQIENKKEQRSSIKKIKEKNLKKNKKISDNKVIDNFLIEKIENNKNIKEILKKKQRNLIDK